jgi:hypothetical protein
VEVPWVVEVISWLLAPGRAMPATLVAARIAAAIAGVKYILNDFLIEAIDFVQRM